MLLHATLLPLVVGAIVVWHVLLVRLRGVVPTIDPIATSPATSTTTTTKPES
jgi:ubiquinol-cytochrome c reductase cytochrome b subunit